MASVYTNELFGAHAVSDETFTVPSNLRWIITCITVFYPGGDAAPGVQIVNTATLVTRFFDTTDISLVGVFRIFAQDRIVFLEGQTFQITGTGNPDVSINGYELTLP